jgi:hypothetical protein
MKPHSPDSGRQIGCLNTRFGVCVWLDLVEARCELPPAPSLAVSTDHAGIQQRLIEIEDDSRHDEASFHDLRTYCLMPQKLGVEVPAVRSTVGCSLFVTLVESANKVQTCPTPFHDIDKSSGKTNPQQ